MEGIGFVVIERDWPAEVGRTPSGVERLKLALWEGDTGQRST